MPHILANMDAAIGRMAGNATADSSLIDLKAIYHAVDALIGPQSTIETQDQAHEFCDKVSGFLVGDFEFETAGRGSDYDITSLIAEGNAVLGN